MIVCGQTEACARLSSTIMSRLTRALLQFLRDLVARATIVCHTSVLVSRAKMTQVTSRNNKYFSTWNALRTFARNFFSIDFFLKILPLKDDELAMSEM